MMGAGQRKETPVFSDNTLLRSWYVNNNFGERSIPTVEHIGNHNQPGLFVIPPFAGNIWEPKTQFLLRKAETNNLDFVSFGYSGITYGEGKITGIDIRCWVDDAHVVFHNKTQGAQVVVASSFGATAALQIARDFPERVGGLVLIAPGTSLEEHLVQPIIGIKGKRRDAFEQTGRFDYPAIIHSLRSERGFARQRIELTAEALQRAKMSEIFRDASAITLQCPVRIIHCVNDKHVPIAASHDLASRIKAPNPARVIHNIDVGHEQYCKRGFAGIWPNVGRMLGMASNG